MKSKYTMKRLREEVKKAEESGRDVNEVFAEFQEGLAREVAEAEEKFYKLMEKIDMEEKMENEMKKEK